MTKRVSQYLGLGLALALAACNAEVGADAGSDDPGTDTDTDTDTDTGPCGCVPISDWATRNGPTPEIPACGELICPEISVGWEPETATPIFDNPEAIDCALEALRDQTPGMLRWRENFSSGGNNGYIVIHATGDLVRRGWGLADLMFVIGAAEAGEAQPSAFFDDCLAETDPGARLDCVQDAMASVTELCDEGWEFAEC